MTSNIYPRPGGSIPSGSVPGGAAPYGYPSYAQGVPHAQQPMGQPPLQQSMFPQTLGQQHMTPPPGTSGATISGPFSVPQPTPVAGITPPGQLPIEQSYIENILRLNLGKMATIYMTFENNSEWNAKVFKGRLEAAGRDHIIISDPATGLRYLLLMVNLDYITFDQELNYTYPIGGGTQTGR
ncbi:spore coat protein GerQ [Paenibacillus ginsengihumi]|uniref:spore coat protein GerQ n=1 Tax=Paenibacillus ginsengihumi TaxID=431596 RepID=UPI00036A9629|nr:spore coat protein GerQ [Paenibacillus ginsengihumi]